MAGFMHTSETPRHTRNLKPIVLGDGAIQELEHQALMAPEDPDPAPMFARKVVLDIHAHEVSVEDVSTDEHPLM